MTNILRAAFAAAVLAALALLTVTLASPAHAAVSGHRWHAYAWARTQHGAWYSWGGTGPYSAGYDCSGLVYRAYRREGFRIPRTTYSMLGWWRLHRVTKANSRVGDLAFYGSGHVELVGGRRYTYGAQQAGTRVGWHWVSRYYHPTMYFHVGGAR